MVEKVTIVTVARQARVSRQTVSNVIHSPQVVSPETRTRVEEAIAALGYRANQAARQMRTGRSRLIAVRIEPTRDGINGWVLDRFLHGLTEAAAARGYRVMLYTAQEHQDEIGTYEDLLAAYDLDAFVLHGTDHADPRPQWLIDHDVPFVTFGRPWDESHGRPWVDIDGAAGTASATRRLIEAGHRRIAFIGWPPGSGTGDDRRAGWLRALREAGLAGDARTCLDPELDNELDTQPEQELDRDLDRETEDGVAQGETCARTLLAQPDPPTAVVCASDSLAVGALRAANDAGRTLAITGFDDTPVAEAVGLTSVRQPLPEAAARCMDLLITLLDGGPGDPQTQVLLAPSITVRRTA